jgi:hypothetical protein
MKKKVYIAVSLVVAVGAIMGASVPAAHEQIPIGDVEQGFKIAPVPLNMAGRDPLLVGWGSYLVNAVGSCNQCHTAPSFADGFNPFMGQPAKVNVAGYLGGGQQFGPFTSRNLTPEDDGKPAGMTFEEFQQAFQQGKDLDMAHPQMSPLLQVMPWPAYAHMPTRQVRAIYEYLSAIPSVKVPGVQVKAHPRQ